MGQRVKRTSRDIRVANRFEVLRHIIASSPVPRQEIALDTGLSLATVSNLVGELIQVGLLEEVGFQDSQGGRPRALVAARRAGGVLAGVDVAETYVHVELFDTGLNVLASVEEPLHPQQENRPEQVVGHIVSSLRTAQREAGVDLDQALGVGISVPGQVDPYGGVSVFAPNWDWHDVPLRDQLAAELHVPLYLDNPLRAGVLAELWFGAGRGHDDVAVLTLGTGVGAGLAFHGQLYRGATNSAGEWGHTTLVMDGRPCRCGSRGCVEAYVGAPGIMAQLHDLAPDEPAAVPGRPDRDDRRIGRGVPGRRPGRGRGGRRDRPIPRGGDRRSDQPGQPEVVVLSSWVAARLGEPLLQQARALLARHALSRPLANTEIVLCPARRQPGEPGRGDFRAGGLPVRDRRRRTGPARR